MNPCAAEVLARGARVAVELYVIAEVATGFPLSWPAGWARTPADQRQRSRYALDFVRSRDRITRELRLMGARDVVVSSNVPLRRDGLPLARMREPEDPGVAVYWLARDPSGRLTRRVMACDCWRTVRENLRALSIALQALRAAERSGAAEVLDRMAQSFSLPPPASPTSGPHWRSVLGLRDAQVTREQVEAAYRELVQEFHPDAGGTHEAMIELNHARSQALQELG